ncbi:MAG: HlyD family type I secretion periplasmic adaptor subunit [Magnetococcales bacterium]|nr:HlyD family type I secretion periplasmic adaptor subunit [Magnetococcales bacterium]
MNSNEEKLYIRELRLAVMRPPRIIASLVLFSIVGFVSWAGIWAHGAVLDEVTSGHGKVIPSSQLKVIQNLEGGIISAILVREGDLVKKGQSLLRIDDTRFKSTFLENKTKQLSFMAVEARLKGEIAQKFPRFPEILKKENPQLVKQELNLMLARAEELAASVSILYLQQHQKKQDLQEFKNKLEQFEEERKLINEELAILKPMVTSGVAPRLDLLRVLKEKNTNSGEIDSAKKGIQRSQEAIEEIKQKVVQAKASFKTKAVAELNEVTVNLKALNEKLSGDADVIKRTDMLAPVTGTVKEINVTTIGQVIQPGEPLMEIVPLEDSLLVEAKIRPADIAFIHPGQTATVKITAFDFAIYGALSGKLERISADTIMDEDGESYYKIRVRTKGSLKDKEGMDLPIIAGMVAEVDILTGHKTVLEYMLKPILRAQHKAFRER